ncbi:MAG: hemin uptake protein HemP [Betaproteobacteria bacterium]|nr:hemin uptake protein HemP [Betaproteobacteria bacterium]
MTAKSITSATPDAAPKSADVPGTLPMAGTAALDSASLLGRDGVVDIVHGTERYTLRKTKQGKLILTK